MLIIASGLWSLSPTRDLRDWGFYAILAVFSSALFQREICGIVPISSRHFLSLVQFQAPVVSGVILAFPHHFFYCLFNSVVLISCNVSVTWCCYLYHQCWFLSSTIVSGQLGSLCLSLWMEKSRTTVLLLFTISWEIYQLVLWEEKRAGSMQAKYWADIPVDDSICSCLYFYYTIGLFLECVFALSSPKVLYGVVVPCFSRSGA